MQKFWWVVLNIFTFGIPYAYAKNKAKKLVDNSNNVLQVSSKIDFNIDDLIKSFGGIKNIIASTATISTLKVDVKNGSQILKEAFVDFNIKGFMKNGNQIILVFGDNSQAISDELKKRLI